MERNGHPDPVPQEPGLREKKKHATRRALHTEALRLFNEKGYSGTSVDEIAAAAEVSRSTFFRYFRTKEDVLFAGTEEAGLAFLKALRARPPQEDALAAFEEALVDLAASINAEAEDRREISRLSEALLQSDPELRVRSQAVRDRWGDEIAAVFAERAGRQLPGHEDRLAASVCLAATDEMGRAFRSGEGDADLVALVKRGFARLRGLIEPSG